MVKPAEEFSISRFLERPYELRNVPYCYIDAYFENNKRNKYGNIDWLARSIMQHGLKLELVLYAEACPEEDPKALYHKGTKSHPEGFYKLVVQDGHRRYLAIEKAIREYGATTLKNVPCRGTTKHETKEQRLLNQILMNSGKNFEPIEMQAVFRELFDLGWSEETIAQQASCSITYVKSLLELSTVEELTKFMIERDELSSSLVIGSLGEVRQIAQLEKKSESEVFQELAEKSKRSNGKVKASLFKESLAERRKVLLQKNDPNYFLSLNHKELIKEVANRIGVVNDKDAVITIPAELWEAIKAKAR